MRHRLLRRVIGAVAVLVMLSGAAAVATGRVSYVTTRGTSMLPKYRTGDVVVLHSSGSYHVGEIVAYRSPLLHSIVLHRIVAESDGLFTFKGDNNSFVDPLRLPASAIEGTDLIDLPHQFSFLTEDPAFVEVVLFVLFLAGVLVVVGAPKVRRPDTRASRPASHPPESSGRPGAGWLIGGLAGICLCGAFAADGLSTAGSHRVTETLPYSQKVVFTYSASAPRDTTYPSGTVTTGMPVFLDLVKAVTVRATYGLAAGTSSDVSGTISIAASVVESDGWSHVLAVSPAVRFRGTSGSAALTLPLQQALDLAHAASAETGVEQGGESVVVTPTITTDGTIGGQPMSGTASPRLTFELNPLELSLLSGTPAGSPALYPQLVSTDPGSVHRYIEVSGAVDVLGVRTAPAAAVPLGFTGLAVSVAGAALGLIGLRRRRTDSEDQRALRRVERELVPVASDPSQSSASVVDVATLAALVGLAERFDVGMLRYRYGSDEFYFVPIGEILYRCSGHAVQETDIVVADSVRRADRSGPPPTAPRPRPGSRRARAHPAVTTTVDAARSGRTGGRATVVDISKGRHARRRSRSWITRPPEVETYEELLTYGTPDAAPADAGLNTFPLWRPRPRKLSGHGAPKHAKGSGRGRRAS